jgi:hypothetical protein
MKLRILSLLFCISIVSNTYAQFLKLSGKVLNDKNEPIAGVTIKAAGGEVTSTNVEGQFELDLAPGKKHEVRFTAIGYKPKVVSDVALTSGQLNEFNIVLETESRSLNNIVVTSSSSSRKETVNSLITYQKNTNTIAQVVSAEAIRRSPDKNTGEVLKRVPGTSIQEGKYLVVRGLADRYNQALLNGVLLGTTEPDRKSFSFDIFPSSIIDNIIINKAFVPEYPGEWAGGLVQVNTKDVPAANFLNIQVGTGFNSQTIGKDFYTYKGGKYDWLGFDDGTRGLPPGFPTSKQFTALSRQEQVEYSKKMENTWSAQPVSSRILPLLNTSFQLSGGINTHIGKNKLGGVVALTYNRSLRNLQYNNSIFVINEVDQDNRKYDAVSSFSYSNHKYSQDVLWGGLANVTLQLGNNSKISSKTLVNINATDYAIDRVGKDYEGAAGNIGDNVKATELAFRSNTFFNTQ